MTTYSTGSRVTGRAAILVLVLAVLAVSYASSMRAYLQQKDDLDALRAEIAMRQAHIDDLERQRDRWRDPAYVKQQARARLSYLMPGETGFQVLGPDGTPLRPSAELPKVDTTDHKPVAWWDRAWGSVELAGNPPDAEPEPDPAEHVGP